MTRFFGPLLVMYGPGRLTLKLLCPRKVRTLTLTWGSEVVDR